MSRVVFGNLTIDGDRFEVFIDDRRIDLTFVEFELLHHLVRNAGKVVGRSRLMQQVWKEHSNGSDTKLTVHMSRLRKKLGNGHPWRIQTISRRGYALLS